MKNKVMVVLVAVATALAAMGCWFCWHCPSRIYAEHELFWRQLVWNGIGLAALCASLRPLAHCVCGVLPSAFARASSRRGDVACAGEFRRQRGGYGVVWNRRFGGDGGEGLSEHRCLACLSLGYWQLSDVSERNVN